MSAEITIGFLGAGKMATALARGFVRAGLVAAGLTGSWVRTVQGFIFLVAIVFYMYVDEPQRRASLMLRLRSIPGFGGAPASRPSASE